MVDATGIISARLCGTVLVTVERRENDWLFVFSDQSALTIPCVWRIIASGRLALGDEDHGQKFGLPAPLDGAVKATRLLGGKQIAAVTIREDTGDLLIAFETKCVLEVINNSSGYEGWQLDFPETSIIALGGGEIAIVNSN